MILSSNTDENQIHARTTLMICSCHCSSPLFFFFFYHLIEMHSLLLLSINKLWTKDTLMFCSLFFSATFSNHNHLRSDFLVRVIYAKINSRMYATRYMILKNQCFPKDMCLCRACLTDICPNRIRIDITFNQKSIDVFFPHVSKLIVTFLPDVLTVLHSFSRFRMCCYLWRMLFFFAQMNNFNWITSLFIFSTNR